MKGKKTTLGLIGIAAIAVFVLTISTVLAVTITFDAGTPSFIANGGSLATAPGTVPIGPSAT